MRGKQWRAVTVLSEGHRAREAEGSPCFPPCPVAAAPSSPGQGMSRGPHSPARTDGQGTARRAGQKRAPGPLSLKQDYGEAKGEGTSKSKTAPGKCEFLAACGRVAGTSAVRPPTHPFARPRAGRRDADVSRKHPSLLPVIQKPLKCRHTSLAS